MKMEAERERERCYAAGFEGGGRAMKAGSF